MGRAKDDFEVFNFTWFKRFGEDVSASERESWLEGAREAAREAGISYIHQSAEDGFEFAFPDQDNYTAFTLNLSDSYERNGEHAHTQSFVDTSERYRESWLALARTHLDQLGASYASHLDGEAAVFSFETSADAALFLALVNTGILDDSASWVDHFQPFRQPPGARLDPSP